MATISHLLMILIRTPYAFHLQNQCSRASTPASSSVLKKQVTAAFLAEYIPRRITIQDSRKEKRSGKISITSCGETDKRLQKLVLYLSKEIQLQAHHLHQGKQTFLYE